MLSRLLLSCILVVELLAAGLFSPAAAGTLGRTTVGTTNYPMSFGGRVLLEDVDGITCGLQVGDQGYFGAAQRERIVQLDLAHLTPVRSLDLEPGEDLIGPPIESDGFGYFSMFFGKIVKVDLASLTRVDALQLPTEGNLVGAFTSGGFAYFADDDSPGKIMKVDPATFATVGVLKLPLRAGQIASSVVVGDFAYLATNSQKIVRVDLRTFSVSTMVSPLHGLEQFEIGVISVGRFAYFIATIAPRHRPYELIKIDLRNLKRVGTLVFSTADGNLTDAIVTDGRSAYIGTQRRGRIVRVDLATLQRVGALVLPNDFLLAPAVTDGVSAYFGAKRGSIGGATEVVKASYGTPQGAIHATRAILSQAMTPRSISLHTHEAGAMVRLAIYDSAKTLVWESPPVPVRQPNSTLTVRISGGTPAQLPRLQPGTYYLAWQVDSARNVPSYKRGEDGSGWRWDQPFGPFPAQVTGELTSKDNWTEFVSY